MSIAVKSCSAPRCFAAPTRKLVRGIATNQIKSRPAAPRVARMPSSLRYPFPDLSYHWETLPPTLSQLKHASEFFSKQPPTFLWSASKFRSMDFGDSPEVCFLGRSNVGKSSLLNALLNKQIAHTSSKAGRTRLMNAFAMGESDENGKNRLVVLDMPGYGKGGRAEWGQEILKYLKSRPQLKMAFVLIDAEHGIKPTDHVLLSLFQKEIIPHQIVLAKVDKLLFPGRKDSIPTEEALEPRFTKLRAAMEVAKDTIQPDLEEDGGGLGEVVACSAEKRINGKKLGIDAVRFAMLRAAEMELPVNRKQEEATEYVSYEELEARGQGW